MRSKKELNLPYLLCFWPVSSTVVLGIVLLLESFVYVKWIDTIHQSAQITFTISKQLSYRSENIHPGWHSSCITISLCFIIQSKAVLWLPFNHIYTEDMVWFNRTSLTHQRISATEYCEDALSPHVNNRKHPLHVQVLIRLQNLH